MNEHYMEKLNAGYIQTANRPAIVAPIATKVAGIPVAVTPLGSKQCGVAGVPQSEVNRSGKKNFAIILNLSLTGAKNGIY